jgi:Spy/CpxP family protein refolding chaperone
MLRKIFSLGALVVVAVTFGVTSATAAPKSSSSPAAKHSQGGWNTDGFSDGRN